MAVETLKVSQLGEESAAVWTTWVQVAAVAGSSNLHYRICAALGRAGTSSLMMQEGSCRDPRRTAALAASSRLHMSLWPARQSARWQALLQ